MLSEVLLNPLGVSVLAKAAITWTPLTFYITAAIAHLAVIMLTFKLLHVDPEHNTFVGALVAAAVGNGAVYLLNSFGLFGILGSAAIFFAVLAAVSSGEVLKSLAVFLVLLGVYAALGHFITQRTPLTVQELGGLPQAVMTGGLTAEPITEKQTDELMAPTGSGS